MPEKPQAQLNYALQSTTSPCVAVIGSLDSCRDLVLGELATLQLEHDHFVDVPTMPSLEEIKRYQRENTVVREGVVDKPSFIRSFLAINNFQQMPQVLVLNGFNLVPSGETYFLKTLLDQQAREDDECYQSLRSIVLITTPIGADGSFDIDPDVRGCIRCIVSLPGCTPD